MSSIVMEFMRTRRNACKTPVEIVTVNWLGGGKMNQCLDNAHRMIRTEEIDIVSGWLALPYDEKSKQHQYTQHWWNFSRSMNQFIDTSPDIEDGAIYIYDIDIAYFAALNLHRLTSCVPLSVGHCNGQFFGIRQLSDGFHLNPLENLTMEELFEPYIISTPVVPKFAQ